MSLFWDIHYVCSRTFFFDSAQRSPAFFIHQKKRERWLLPYLQLGVFLFMRVSFLPLVFNPLVSPVCWCWSQIVKQAAPSKRRQALWLLLSQSHISLFRLLVHIRTCVYVCVASHVCVCVRVWVSLPLCVLRLCVTLASQSQVMISSSRWLLETYIKNYTHTHTRTHTKRVKSGSRDWYCNGTLMGYLTSAFS